MRESGLKCPECEKEMSTDPRGLVCEDHGVMVEAEMEEV